MNEEPKSIWKKPRTGWRSFLFWILIVSIAAFLFAVLLAIFTSVKTTLFDKHSGLENFVGYGLIVWFWFLIAVAFVLVFYGIVRWFFCWRNLKRFLFGLACFATLVALFYAEEDWRGKHDWEKFKREWVAKGEHFDFASVIPKPVPDDQNFALTPVVASCYETYFDRSGHEVRPRNTNVVDRLSMITWRDNRWAHAPESSDWLVQQKTDLKSWQEYFRASPPTNSIETNSFPTTPQPQTPAEDVLLALSKYNPAVEELRAVSRLPDSRFPLTYDTENPAMILLPHLAALKSCALALNLRSLAELQTGQSALALADVKLSLRLADSIRTEPVLISHLVRISMVNLALQPVWEGLAKHQWSDAQLGELNEELGKLDFLADYGTAIRGECGLGMGVIEFLQHNRSLRNLTELSNVGGVSDNPLTSLGAVLYGLSPSGWFDQNKLRICRFYAQWYYPLADVEREIISPAAVRLASKAYQKAVGGSRINPYNRLEQMFMPALAESVKKFAAVQSSVDLARVAIALERYRLAHGEFPESLDALAPQFIAQVPHDVIGGQPLKYRREANGQFILYSVGWNETDDGGVIGHHNDGVAPYFESGDWVWRYPQQE